MMKKKFFGMKILLGAFMLAFIFTGCSALDDALNDENDKEGAVIDTNWLNANNWTIGQGSTSSYSIDHYLTVPNGKTLTIMPGTTIIFTVAGAGIKVEAGGTIIADGEASRRIILKDSALKWRGIAIASPTANVLNYVDIINAGSGTSDWSAAVEIDNGSASITNCVIDGSGSNGVYTYNTNANFTAFENNTIKNCAKAPVYTYDRIWSLRNISVNNTFTGNANNYIHVRDAGSITNDMTIKKLPIPWRLYSTFNVNDMAALTVEPGTIIEFGNAGSGINVAVGAAITMDGGSSAGQIILRGSLNTKGSWSNIIIRSIRPENKLNYVSMLNGGSGTSDWSAVVELENGSASVTNCIIDGSGSNGVYLYNINGYFTAFENNAISNCEKAAIHLYSGIYALRNISSNNTFTGNTNNWVHVRVGDSITANMTLKKLSIPYYLPAGLSIDNAANPTMTIEPGTQVWVGAGQQINVGDNSKLVAIGTATERIVFRGSTDVAGWWRGIDVRTNLEGTKFAYCDISGGGSGDGWSANRCLYVCNAYIQLLNVHISKSLRYGIGLEGTYYICSSGVTFDACQQGNVWYYDGSPTTVALPTDNFVPTEPLVP